MKIICLRVFFSCSFKNKDKLSCIIYEVFEVYIDGDYLFVRDYFRKVIFFWKMFSDIVEGIGIFVIKFYKCL